MFKFEEPMAMCVSLGKSARAVFVYEDEAVEEAYYNVFQDKESYNPIKRNLSNFKRLLLE